MSKDRTKKRWDEELIKKGRTNRYLQKINQKDRKKIVTKDKKKQLKIDEQKR